MIKKGDVMNRKLATKQQGFTLVEIIVVLAIIAVLIGILVPTVRSKLDEANFKSAEIFFAKNMQESLLTLFGRLGTVNGVSAERLQGTGLGSQTPWGGVWSMDNACANERCVITYPVGGVNDSSKLANGNDLAAKLTREEGGQPINSHIVAAVYDSGSGNLTVTVRVR